MTWRPRWPQALVRAIPGRVAAVALALLAACLVGLTPALALSPIIVNPDDDRIEITTLGELHEGRGDMLQVETAPGLDGVTGRMAVRATTLGTNPNWIVFALRNQTDKPIERWLTAERYTLVGSGIVWPDLDARRIEAVTPSFGYLPDRIRSDRADIFRISLDPGQTITYVAELSSDRFARIYLWKPIEYEVKARDRLLFNGVLLGSTCLLAIFLTAVFGANHKAIFPSSALVAWCAFGYLCVDFGFFHKLFQLRPEDNSVYRAATESALAASLVIFLHTFLKIGSWHGFIRMLAGVWIVGQLALVAVAVVDPRLAATFARLSFGAIGAIGALLTLFLALRGQDRAFSLIPLWILFLVWVFATALTLTGRLSGDIFVTSILAGLLVTLLLLTFTVTQYAFRSVEPLYGPAPNELQLRSLAVDGAGAAVWEWHARREEIKVSPVVEAVLGLAPGVLSAKVEDFAKHMHTADRERFRLLLWSAQEKGGGPLHGEFRMRHADNSYRWFELEAASVPTTDQRSLRCVGLMRDITESKRAHERLMHDAVHDSLTGLPNRELFLDRLGVAVTRAQTEPAMRPTLLFIDLDKFKSVNSTFGLIVGDSLLLTVARRLGRHLGPQDTLARVGGDQFAVLMPGAHDPRELAMHAERIRRSLRAPIKISGQEIVLTASVGLAVYDGQATGAQDLLKDAEIAMYRAKRAGADRIEIFQPEMRNERDDRIQIESDLRVALERGLVRVLYQPIIYLPTEELVGFEALVRWDHPRLGAINPDEFVPVAEESDLIVTLGSYVLGRAAKEAMRWSKELPRAGAPLFVSVNISSRQLFHKDLIQEVRQVIGRGLMPEGALRLEITESLVMENPEQAADALEQLRAAGAGLAMDDFGAGYSSFAYLQRFAFDTIKIDRMLVQASGDEGPGAVIVRSIVALSHELGKKVVAEGVETSEDVTFLRSIGCELAQGFYYGEPMPDRDVVQLLRVIRKSERKLQRRGFFRTSAARPRARKAAVIADQAAPPPPPSSAADAALSVAANARAPNGPLPLGPEDAAASSVKRGLQRLGGGGLGLRLRTRRPDAPQAGPTNGSALPPLPPTPLQPTGGNGSMLPPATPAWPAPPPIPPTALTPGAHHGPPPIRGNGSAPGTRPPPVPGSVPPPPQFAVPPSPTIPRNGVGPHRTRPPNPTRPPAGAPPPRSGATQPPRMPPPAFSAPAAPQANFNNLPPAIAESLAKLAGLSVEEMTPTRPPTTPRPTQPVTDGDRPPDPENPPRR